MQNAILKRKSYDAITLYPFWSRTVSSREATSMLAILLLAVGPPAATQTASQQATAINGLVTSYVSDHRVPGLSVAVIDGGRVILIQGYGLADVENNV